jgi:formylmethanofuran dehydrogenase subunit C
MYGESLRLSMRMRETDAPTNGTICTSNPHAATAGRARTGGSTATGCNQLDRRSSTGNAGRRVAAGMSGGLVEVLGSVGDAAGIAMQGGALRVRGDAGDDLGAAEPGVARGMAGGEIVVRGSAGASAATRLRRGVVAVAGDLGARGGEGMIAGTLLVLGRSGPGAGRGSRRGSIVACGAVEIPVTYRYACTFEPAWVRMLLTWLHRHHGLPLVDAMRDGHYRRYCGDAGPPGRGEILVLDRERVEHS